MKLSSFLQAGSRISFDAPIENDLDLGEDGDDMPETDEVMEDQPDAAPKNDPDAEDRIPKAWSTIDRVLDVWYKGSKPGQTIQYCDYRGTLDPEESMELVVQGYFKWCDRAYVECESLHRLCLSHISQY